MGVPEDPLVHWTLRGGRPKPFVGAPLRELSIGDASGAGNYELGFAFCASLFRAARASAAWERARFARHCAR